ncbi:DUF3833 domain-containing protein [Bowmanella denitrificans]|uniref:DUF3833 domain-containing protein n=1 Tax=Bowmanella denitrificans TaxID=366582 RepID=A0ABN0X1S7_9ALTE
MKKLIFLVMLTCLTACSSSLDEHQINHPEFDLKGYFDGNIHAWGIVQDYSRRLTRQFCVDIQASWQNNNGTLHETFYFDDGEQQVRIWQLEIHPDGSVSGTAGDVVGTATGKAKGNALNWQYVLSVPIDNNVYEFSIDDWLFQMDSQHMMNRSYMQKFGVTVAEISIFFKKTRLPASCSSLPSNG